MAFQNSTTAWSEYGSYISGATSFLNLLVFILLTIYVAQLGNSNSTKQLETQRKILLTQFKQSDLVIINKNLSKPFSDTTFKDFDEVKKLLTHFTIYLHQLPDQYSVYFPYLNSEEFTAFKSKIVEETRLAKNLISGSTEFKELKEDEQNSFAHIFTEIINNKNKLISKLQISILEELK